MIWAVPGMYNLLFGEQLYFWMKKVGESRPVSGAMFRVFLVLEGTTHMIHTYFSFLAWTKVA